MKKRPKTMWMIAQAAVLAALLLAVLWSGANTVSVSAMMSMIIAVLIVWVVRWKRTVDVQESGERTKKLGAMPQPIRGC